MLASRFTRMPPLFVPRTLARALAGAAAAAAAAAAAPGAARADGAGAAAAPYAPRKKFRVGVLGATGAVGQRFVQALDAHPWFELVSLGASERSVGKPYGTAAHWLVSPSPPPRVAAQTVVACEPKAMPTVDFVFSALVSGGARGAAAAGPLRRRRLHVPQLSSARPPPP